MFESQGASSASCGGHACLQRISRVRACAQLLCISSVRETPADSLEPLSERCTSASERQLIRVRRRSTGRHAARRRRRAPSVLAPVFESHPRRRVLPRVVHSCCTRCAKCVRGWLTTFAGTQDVRVPRQNQSPAAVTSSVSRKRRLFQRGEPWEQRSRNAPASFRAE